MDFIRPIDLDNDGDLDILMRRADIAVAWLQNLGGGEFATVTNLTGVSGCKDFTVYDLDNDGDNDIVKVLEEGFSVKLNNGNQVFSSAGSYYLPTVVFTGYSIALVDIDLVVAADQAGHTCPLSAKVRLWQWRMLGARRGFGQSYYRSCRRRAWFRPGLRRGFRQASRHRG